MEQLNVIDQYFEKIGLKEAKDRDEFFKEIDENVKEDYLKEEK